MGTRELAKLKMEKPEYYDATDNRAAVIQKSSLEKIVKDARHAGLRIGSWWGSLAFGSSLLFSLETTEKFREFMGIGGFAWQAIFVIGLAISVVVFITLSVALAPTLFRFLFNKTATKQDSIFNGKNKIGIKEGGDE